MSEVVSLAPSWETAARIWLIPKESHEAQVESEDGILRLGRAIDFISAGFKDGTITITDEAGEKLIAILNGGTQ